MRRVLPLLIVLLPGLFATSCNSSNGSQSPNQAPVEPTDWRRLVRSEPGMGIMHMAYADISPDGRYWLHHHELLKDVSIYDIQTRTVRTLYHPRSDSGYIESMRFSRDGSLIAYVECCDPGYVLRIGSAETGEARSVGLDLRGIDASYDRYDWMTPLDWIRSDSVLLLVQVPAVPNRSIFAIVLVSIADGGHTTVDLPGFPIYSKLSPDGRTILVGPGAAIAGGVGEGWKMTDVYVQDRATGRRSIASQNGYPLGWSADGHEILYAVTDAPLRGIPDTYRPRRIERRRVRSDGRLEEPVVLVDDMVRTLPFLARAGRLYAIVTSSFPVLQLASVDLERGVLLSNPEPLSEDTVSPWDRRSFEWSPDGRRFAYFEGDRGMEQTVVIQTADDAQRQTFAASPDFAAPNGKLRWDPSGDALLLIGRGREVGTHRLVRLDLATGSFRDLATFRNPGGFAVSPDGRTVYVSGGQGTAAVTPGVATGRDGAPKAEGPACAMQLAPVDGASIVPTGGDCRTVFTWGVETKPGPFEGCVIDHRTEYEPSPNGFSLAVDTGECIGVVAESGGSVRWLTRRSRKEEPSSINWVSRGSGLLYSRLSMDADGQADRPVDLVYLDLATQEERVALTLEHLISVRISPDGARILFRGGETITELWVTELLE